MAGIEEHTPGNALLVGTQYTLRAGVVSDEQSIPAYWLAPTLPPDLVTGNADQRLLIEVVVHAEDIDVLTPDHQTCVFVPSREVELLRFTLLPRNIGRKRITVMFYHERRWLQNVLLEVDVVERSAVD